MSTCFFFLFGVLSTTSVPCTLVSIVRTGLSTISLTPTAAARWKTTSHSVDQLGDQRLVEDAVDRVVRSRGWPFRCAMLSMLPVDRSSRTMTSSPRAEQASARCEPMNPAPPVMRTPSRVTASFLEKRIGII